MQINLGMSQNSFLVDCFTIKLVRCEITLLPLNHLYIFNPYTVHPQHTPSQPPASNTSTDFQQPIPGSV